MTDLLRKFTSRKFIAMLTGVLTGLGVVIAGNLYEGLSAVLLSVLTYLAAEGIIDAKALSCADR